MMFSKLFLRKLVILALATAVLATIVSLALGQAPVITAAGGTPRVTQAAWRTLRETHGDTTIVRTVGVGRDSSRVRLVQEISIGKREGSADESFSAISRVRPTADGGVILADGMRPAAIQVKLFGPAGNFVRNVGRIGQGPGEYTFPAGIAVAARGQLLVWGRNGVSVYAANGTYDTTWSAPAPSGQFVDAAGRVYAEGTMNDPELPDSIVPPVGRRVQRNITIRTSLRGVVIDTIVSPRAQQTRRLFASMNNGVPPDRIVTPQPGQFVAYSTQIAIPYVPQFITVVSPLGYYVSGDAGHYALTLKSPAGKPLRIESDRAAVAVDAEERRARYDYIRSRTEAIAPADIAHSKPFFKGLRVDDDGRIWVWLFQPSVRASAPVTGAATAPGASQYTWTEPISVYDVFAPSGEFLGSVRFPERATFAAAKGGKLWLVLSDELGVPRVVRYRIEGLRPN